MENQRMLSTQEAVVDSRPGQSCRRSFGRRRKSFACNRYRPNKAVGLPLFSASSAPPCFVFQWFDAIAELPLR